MSFWTGADIEDRVALGSLNLDQARQEQGYRAAQRDALLVFLRSCGALADEAAPPAVLEAWLTTLAGGAEEFLLVNLEDLWLECEPQNVPGTWLERPNWQRKARHGLDEIRARPEISLLLRKIGDIRRRIR